MVGLGNPGSEYDGTRHNVGAEVVHRLAARYGGSLRKGRERALAAEVRVGGRRLVLAIPITYMNDSGMAVAPLVRRHGIEDLTRLVVVQDELDLPLGVLKVKSGGGTAGHNGLESIKAHLKSSGFVRVRIGIGKPGRTAHGGEWVLKRPSKSERAELEVVVEEAADAVELILGDGLERAMNVVNSRPTSGSS